MGKDSTVLSGLNPPRMVITKNRKRGAYNCHDDLQYLLDQASPILELSDIEIISSGLNNQSQSQSQARARARARAGNKNSI